MKTRLAVAATLAFGMIANACAFDYASVNFAGTVAPFPGHPEGLVSSAQGVPSVRRQRTTISSMMMQGLGFLAVSSWLSAAMP